MKKLLIVILLLPCLASCSIWQTRSTTDQKVEEKIEKKIDKVTKETIVEEKVVGDKILKLKTNKYKEEMTKEQALKDQLTDIKTQTDQSSPALDNVGGLVSEWTTGDMALGGGATLGLGLLAKKAFSFVKGRILNPKPDPQPPKPNSSDKARRREEDEES